MFPIKGMDMSSDSLLTQGRILFYKSVEDKSHIDSAKVIFSTLVSFDSLAGRATTYLGGLRALDAKYAIVPTTKLARANEGLDTMDRGIAMAPSDIESRFIRGMTCFYLPFFFGRKGTAREDFAYIINHLPETHSFYDRKTVLNVIQFLEENIDLTETERQRLELIK